MAGYFVLDFQRQRQPRVRVGLSKLFFLAAACVSRRLCISGNLVIGASLDEEGGLDREGFLAGVLESCSVHVENLDAYAARAGFVVWL